MTDLARHILIVLLPLTLSGSLHMLLVKSNGLSLLRIPVWEQGFGKNKTWRGFFFVPLVNGILLFLFSSLLSEPPNNPFLLGYVLGLSCMLAELPNSFLKRKLGIQAGAHPDRNKVLFFILDKTDSALGVALAYYVFGNVSFLMSITLFLIGSFTHGIISLLLVNIKIKSSF